MVRKRLLTDAEWRAVFRARCKVKQGQGLTDEERVLIATAHASDARRYAAMDEEVFNATVPFGSGATWKK